MSKTKPPVLDLNSCDDQQESVELWIDQFDDWCTLQEWRDTSKARTNNEHWKEDHRASEISAFRLALPIQVWRMVKTTIVPAMTAGEQVQPWVWQNKLKEHYSGQDTVLASRMTFMDTCKQKPKESIADFEARCRYHGSKCLYNLMTAPEDELIRDRFVTGVCDDRLRAELLRHKKDDGTVITLNEVVTRAKSWEAAAKTNTQVIEAKHTEEVVHATYPLPAKRLPFSKLQKCGYCGANERHARRACPAAKPGVFCKNCYGDNHFSNVCRSPKDNFKKRWLAKNKQNVNIIDDVRVSEEPDSNYYLSDSYSHDFAYALENNSPSKLFVTLSLSKNGDMFQKCKFQIDSAASCNTMPYKTLSLLGVHSDLKPSTSILHTYSGNTIRPLGKITLLCESENKFDTIDFEVVADSDIQNKPALLGLKDCMKLEILNVDHDRVWQTINSVNKNEEKLTKEQLVRRYPNNFTGVGNLGTPVSFALDQKITPIHAPVHRIPIAKRQRTKDKLDEMVKSGKLSKVEEPTDWCSNMTVVEKIKPNGQIKTRLCIDPSQTINKALQIPKYTIPTMQEILPNFSSKKFKTFTIVDALDGFTQVKLDEKSSILTTMHTPWGRYRWNRLPYGVSSGVEEFQRRIHEAIDGLEGVLGIADDIVIYGLGDSQEEADQIHDTNVIAFMERAETRQLKLNPEKIQFKLKKIAFMGFRISENGVEPDPARIKAISEMLKKIHRSHQGADSNIRLCKDIIFWPGMQAEIKDVCSNCLKCAQFSTINKKEPMLTQPVPDFPWQYVSQDICTYESHNYLITVDHYSDYIEVDKLENTLSSTVIGKSKAQFCRHGIPEILCTDNGPQFISDEFDSFCDSLDINHITSSPYWPQGNGKAESAVKIVKSFMKKSGDLNIALLMYRNTPNQGHTYTPAQRSMGRHTRTTIPILKKLLQPDNLSSQLVQNNIFEKKQKSKLSYDKKVSETELPEIKIGDCVFAKPYDKGIWKYGRVVDKPQARSYTLNMETGHTTRRNRSHIRQAPDGLQSLVNNDWPFGGVNTREPTYSSASHDNIQAQVNGDDRLDNIDQSSDNSNGHDKFDVTKNVTSTSNDKNVDIPKNDDNACSSNTIQGYVTKSGRTVKPKKIFDPS